MKTVSIYAGGRLGDYNFGADHPFGPLRHDAFLAEFHRLGLEQGCDLKPPRNAQRGEIARFHTAEYIDRVAQASLRGTGYLDGGDTPVFPGIYDAAARVVGTVLEALTDLVNGTTRRAFVPIAGLHHARRAAAAGFCVFNDCGVAIETLREEHGIRRVAYVDIDAHHGDGVYYAFEDDPELIVADIHEDGRYLYPGTGHAHETGKGRAKGTKLNIPVPPGADDIEFRRAWDRVEAFVDAQQPEFILMQCGADSLEGDPITHMAWTEEAHAYAAASLCRLADKHCQGRIVATGGGGYNRQNLARAWTRVVQSFVDS